MCKSVFKILFFIVAVLGLIAVHQDARSQKLDLSSFLVDTQEEYLVARLSLHVYDFENIKHILDNGGKMTMLCTATLFRQRTLLWNRKLDSREIEIDLQKDLLTGEYIVKHPEKRIRMQKLSEDDFLSLFEQVTIKIAPWSELRPEQKYSLRVNVRLISRDVPQWIKRILFFWSWDVAKGVQYETGFTL